MPKATTKTKDAAENEEAIVEQRIAELEQELASLDGPPPPLTLTDIAQGAVALVDKDEGRRKTVKRYLAALRIKRLEERAAILKDPEKVVSAVVAKRKEAAPKTFGQQLNGKPAEKVLEERLRNLPRPELVLVAAVLLKAPVISWLDAVREEETA